MIFESNLSKGFFRPVGTKVSKERVILITQLDIIRNLGLALNFNKIYKFISNHPIVFNILISFAMKNHNLNQEQYSSKI
jgi:hypothetical protein